MRHVLARVSHALDQHAGRQAQLGLTCAGCYACVHACPKAAIRFTKYQEPNPEVHYRNPHVTLADLMRAAG